MNNFNKLKKLNLSVFDKLTALEQVSVTELLSINETMKLLGNKITDSFLFDSYEKSVKRKSIRSEEINESFKCHQHYPYAIPGSIWDY